MDALVAELAVLHGLQKDGLSAFDPWTVLTSVTDPANGELPMSSCYMPLKAMYSLIAPNV